MSAGAGPLSVYVMDGSRPLTENKHKSAVDVPAAGRRTVTGLPPSVQVFVAELNVPIATMSRLTFPAAPAPPFVLSSTTEMSFPAADGWPGVRGIAPGPEPTSATTKLTVFDTAPPGF